MDTEAFGDDAPGTLVNSEGTLAFNPDDLPPELDQGQLVNPLTDAVSALGRLEGIGPRVENRQMLISPFMRKEAVVSSRIEGTRATLSDVYAYEAGQEGLIDPQHQSDVREVLNYVQAMEEGLTTLQNGTTIDRPLIEALHETLLADVRGGKKDPGAFRNRQNFIGTHGDGIDDARYVPPPPELVWPLMRQLVGYVQSDDDLHPLVKLGLVHYQFETIHPFMDGNGRVGRLLVSLMLQNEELLPEPYLYLSSYFNEHRDAYTDHLLSVSQKGTWTKWLRFFLRAVAKQANEAQRRAQRLLDLREEYREQYQAERSENVLRLAMELFVQPYMEVPEAKERLGVSYPTANRAMEKLEANGVLEELTGYSKNRIFRATEIYDVLAMPDDEL